MAMAATELTPDDPHYNIPRGRDGSPIFFILPPAVQRDYDQKLARCERGWHATKNPGFIKEAQIWTHLHRQPPLLWLSEAVIALAERRQGKGHATRALRAAIRLMRYQAVLRAPRPGTYDVQTGRRITWDDAYEYAAQALAKTRACGKASTMKEDYRQVRKDFKEGRSGLYYQPLPAFRKLSDVLAGKHRPKY
jgi:hypothetical protein